MKKIIAILLVWIFLFNVIGYYGVYAGLLHQANNKANLAIENSSYDQSETVTIKMPLTLPYPVQNEFKRVTGDFEHNGEFYKLVEQKYENDTLYVVCLKNEDQKKAVEVLSDLVKQSTDQSPSQNQNAKTLTGFLKDFNPVIEEILISSPEGTILAKSFISLNDEISTRNFPVLTPPPNATC